MLRFTPNTPEVGLLPLMLSEDDPRPAKEQLDSGYRHGGGWRPFLGFELLEDDSLAYPGDPPVSEIARAQLRSETIVLYKHAWVAIIQLDRSFEVCRMD